MANADGMRDVTIAEDRIRDAIRDSEEAIGITLSAGLLDQATIRSHLSIARGRYTLGASRASCLEPVATAVQLYCEWAERSDGVLKWSMDPELNNEFLGGAFLAGKLDEVFAVFAKARWATVPAGWQLAALNLLCRAFGGRPPEPDRVHAAVPKMPPPLPPLLPMLEAMADDDVARFNSAFVTFITKSWGPSAEKGAKVALRSDFPLYTGKWSLLAAAACRKMATIPDLPPKAEQYFPRELV